MICNWRSKWARTSCAISGKVKLRALSLRWISGVREWARSPVAIANLAGDGGNLFGRHGAHGAQEFGDHGGAFADDFEQIAGNLPGQGQQGIGIFAQLLGQPADVLFPRRRLLAPLDLAQVGRLDADPVRQLAQRERRIALSFRRAALPQEFSE